MARKNISFTTTVNLKDYISGKIRIRQSAETFSILISFKAVVMEFVIAILQIKVVAFPPTGFRALPQGAARLSAVIRPCKVAAAGLPAAADVSRGPSEP